MHPTGSRAVLEAYRKLFILVVNLSQSGQKNAPWTPLFEWSRKLHELFVCRVCDFMVVDPYRIKSLNCKHTVCKKCIDAGMTGICSLCLPAAAYIVQYDLLQIIFIGYIGLCTYIRAAPFFKETALDNCTNEKLLFMARVTEASLHKSKLIALSKRFNNATSNLPTDVNSVNHPSQASSSSCQTPNETSTESENQSNKRKCDIEPNRNPKQRAVNKTDVESDSSECESNQNNGIQENTDEIRVDQSENSPVCTCQQCAACPIYSSSNEITSEGCM